MVPFPKCSLPDENLLSPMFALLFCPWFSEFRPVNDTVLFSFIALFDFLGFQSSSQLVRRTAPPLPAVSLSPQPFSLPVQQARNSSIPRPSGRHVKGHLVPMKLISIARPNGKLVRGQVVPLMVTDISKLIQSLEVYWWPPSSAQADQI